MGYSLAWLAIKGKSPEAVREALGLRGTGAHEPLPESELAAAVLSGDWYLIVNNDDDHVATDSVLKQLTDSCEAVTCFVEEHVMFSRAAGWKNGEQIWSVEHASELGGKHLEIDGELPANFASVRDQLFSQQRMEDDSDDMRVDYIFDIPVALAESLTGYRHDAVIPGPGDQAFEVLRSSKASATKRSWLRRLFGRK